MNYDPDKHHRRSIRMQGYDYSQPGAYFVTICTSKHECLFGKIDNGDIKLNQYGKNVSNACSWIEKHYPYVKIDSMVIMPNHIHLILIIDDRRGGSRTAPTTQVTFRNNSQITQVKQIKSLGRLIGAFKTISTKKINKIRKTPGATLWQRNYYEHIIRDDKELTAIRQYILDNPLKWEFDRENPENWNSNI